MTARHYVETHPDDRGQLSVPGLLHHFPHVRTTATERVRAANKPPRPTPAHLETRPLIVPGLRPALNGGTR